MAEDLRDHLFISYATEDSVFAEWLTLKLTLEGYKVWCDRVKLLGGESYPRDIDEAIKRRTFRLLAIYSASSVAKENPRKERTLAFNLSRERKEDFLIPLNLGVRPTELDWMVSDLTYISFDPSWATGLRLLLKKLESLAAPRSFSEGPTAVAEWAAARAEPQNRLEELWSNAFEFTAIPEFLFRISSGSVNIPKLLAEHPHYKQSAGTAWTFELPPGANLPSAVRLETVNWKGRTARGGLDLEKVVVNLLRQYVRRRYLERGIREHEENEGRRHPYFGSDGGADRWIPFESYTGRMSRVKVVGYRTFRRGSERERVTYHVSPAFMPNLHLLGRPVLLVRLHVLLTDADGKPLDTKQAHRRRKTVCRSWHNHKWLTRTLGTIQALARDDEGEVLELACASDCQLSLSKKPLRAEVSQGFDEATLAAVADDDDAEIEEDEEIQGLEEDEPNPEDSDVDS